jgi:hypothetical protein
MAMAGLGSPADIWRWPFHYYLAVKAEYLKIVGLVDREDPKKLDEIAPGITVEHYTY